MNSIKQIVDAKGGFAALSHLKVEAAGFMPLVIENIGTGPRGLQLVSVAHYYEQNGDLMKDPDMTFEVDGNGDLHPISYEQSSLGLYQVAVEKMDNGQVGVRPALLRQLKAFARTWNANIKAQGFVKAARA